MNDEDRTWLLAIRDDKNIQNTKTQLKTTKFQMMRMNEMCPECGGVGKVHKAPDNCFGHWKKCEECGKIYRVK